jgi:N-acetylmuramoyl-L-alanine amidase
VTELQVNLDITQRVARILEERGYVVDVIPATVPVRYEADAFVAIHADGSASSRARGFKLATPWRTSRASQHLLEAMQAEYAKATGLPYDSGGITFNMRGYYAFSWRRHDHAAAKTTPAVILEMGFLTNASDRSMMTKRQDMIALAIADGITRYLNERDPNDTAARVPPDFKTHRPVDAGVAVRAAPSEQSKVLFRAGPDNRLFPFQEKDGWMQVVVRGQYRVVGWVRRDQLVETDDPQPTPLPATDS